MYHTLLALLLHSGTSSLTSSLVFLVEGKWVCTLIVEVLVLMGLCLGARIQYSDQVFLVAPHAEDILFNIKFTYVKIFDVIQDFYLVEWYSNIQKSQYKCKLYLAKYSNYNIQVNHNTNSLLLVSRICSLSRWWPSRHQDAIYGSKPAQAYCCLWNSFVSCSVFILCVGLSQIFPPHMLVWLTQAFTLF